MSTLASQDPRPVEVRPEVVFLFELLQELAQGRIPRFQRPFVWRRDQMTDLLDSVHKQYPIGSLLVWETDGAVATLDRLGPFKFPQWSGPVGYLLDGHQLLSTLAGALTSRLDHGELADDADPGRWELAYNLRQERFQHYGASDVNDPSLFPMTALLDTRRFFQEVDRVRQSVDSHDAARFTDDVTTVARSFQHYRVPVIRIRQTGASEAVEIFARLNSKGQAMSADQMVSALMYRDPGLDDGFDLSVELDETLEIVGDLGFPDVDRTAVLRAVLANLGEDIYRTDWTRLTTQKRDELLPRMQDAAKRSKHSLELGVTFLRDRARIYTDRLLPYSMQLVVLSAFFDAAPEPSGEQVAFLEKWFWVSSFSGWFGGTNPSRVNSLVAEFRSHVATTRAPIALDNFDMSEAALPYPTSFDMRSARTRALLSVMLALGPREDDGTLVEDPWRLVAARGPSAIGHVLGNPGKAISGNPANRMLRPPGEERGSLRPWIERMATLERWEVLRSYGVPETAAMALSSGDVDGFVGHRAAFLQAAESAFQAEKGVRSAAGPPSAAPIDTG